jgi:hypothetical protein
MLSVLCGAVSCRLICARPMLRHARCLGSDLGCLAACLQARLMLAANSFEVVDQAVRSLTSLWQRHHSSQPHLLALGVIPLLQPHLRWLVGRPAAARAAQQLPASTSQSTQGRPSGPPNSPPAASGASLTAWHEGGLPLGLAASNLSANEKVDYAISITRLWAATLHGEALDAASWRECLRGALQVLADVAPLLRLAAIGHRAREEGVDDASIIMNASALVFQKLAETCVEYALPAHDGDDSAYALRVEAHLQLTAAMNSKETLPHLDQLVCGGSGSTPGAHAF